VPNERVSTTYQDGSAHRTGVGESHTDRRRPITVFADLWVVTLSHPLGEDLPGYADVAVAGTPAAPTTGAASYVWVSGDCREGYLDDVRDVEGVASLARLEELPDRTLARVELSGTEPGVFRAVDDAGGAVLAYRGIDEGWTVRARFPGRDGVTECCRLCEDRSGGLPCVVSTATTASPAASTTD
jgi:hypothetical protein